MFRRSGKLKILLLAVALVGMRGTPTQAETSTKVTISARPQPKEMRRVRSLMQLIGRITRYAMAAN